MIVMAGRQGAKGRDFFTGWGQFLPAAAWRCSASPCSKRHAGDGAKRQADADDINRWAGGGRQLARAHRQHLPLGGHRGRAHRLLGGRTTLHKGRASSPGQVIV